MAITFSSCVTQAPGMKATGVPVPTEVVDALGASKKPAVTVTIGGFSYRTTVGTMFGGPIVPLSAERRTAAGLVAGQTVEVTIELDLEPHTAEVPDDLVAALDGAQLRAVFDALSLSRQRAHVTVVESAKTRETRDRRIAAVVVSLTPVS